MIRADLHIHSSNSDGSDSVQELMENIKQANLDIFALTDHDTIAGLAEMEKLVPENIKFIKGIEFTCKTNGIKSHILGYGINPNDRKILDQIEKSKQLRKIKLEKRIEHLKNVWDIELSEEELNWLYSRLSPVKTHFANILVKRGLASDNVEAMKKYLDDCKTGNTRLDGEEAISAIKASGGIAIWAHPLGGEGEKHISQDEFVQKIENMLECGIDGLECYYSRYSLQESDFLVQCAEKKNLLISGGSDYHGENKDVKLSCVNSDNIPVAAKEFTVLKSLNLV